ncbi:MAG: hypothetical protein Q4A28_06340 [Brachymonas sp.]|nr:hypothetical protein [Brachymonas sp.]
MKPARNEIEAWQQMAYAPPPTHEDMRPEYGRGPGWVGLIFAIGLAVGFVLLMNFVK